MHWQADLLSHFQSCSKEERPETQEASHLAIASLQLRPSRKHLFLYADISQHLSLHTDVNRAEKLKTVERPKVTTIRFISGGL